MDEFTACCEDCDQEWDQDDQVELTQSTELPETCPYCGSPNILVEA